MSSLSPPVSDDIRCCVCDNHAPEKFNLKYRFPAFDVVECNECSFLFIPPYYRKKIVYTQYKDASVTEAVRSGNNWVKIQRHKLRFRFISKFKKSGTLFDLGAGWGHFMLAAKELGYEVSGIEISEQPYLYCVNDLKLPVRHVDFFTMDEAEKFEIVTMWDVLEHIDNADVFLQKCSRITKAGGYLFLQVPQIDSYIARREKDNWKMMGLDHVNYFSKKTIRQILQKNGYELLEIKSSFEIKLFIMYTLLPLWKKLRSGKKQTLREASSQISAGQRQQYFNKFTSRPKWQLSLFVKVHNVLYNSLSALGIGEEMMVAARKKS
jgi:2-polyprenyl-3-methyl-5-hydroxy-6-metoxy-1,4-benzoquinol methylase